jgi:hypothetical protein
MRVEADESFQNYKLEMSVSKHIFVGSLNFIGIISWTIGSLNLICLHPHFDSTGSLTTKKFSSFSIVKVEEH